MIENRCKGAGIKPTIKRQCFPGPGHSGPRGKDSNSLARDAMTPHQIPASAEQKEYRPRSTYCRAGFISSLPNASREPERCPGKNAGCGCPASPSHATLGQHHCFPEVGLLPPQNRSDSTFLIHPTRLKEPSKKTGETALWKL